MTNAWMMDCEFLRCKHVGEAYANSGKLGTQPHSSNAAASATSMKRPAINEATLGEAKLQGIIGAHVGPEHVKSAVS